MNRAAHIMAGGWMGNALGTMTRGFYPAPPIPMTARRTENVFGDSGSTITGYRWEVDHVGQFIVDHRGYHIGAPTLIKQRAVRVPHDDRMENAGGTP